MTPHIAVDGHLTKTGKTRKTAIDGRTTRHPGYTISQRIRKRIEDKATAKPCPTKEAPIKKQSRTLISSQSVIFSAAC